MSEKLEKFRVWTYKIANAIERYDWEELIKQLLTVVFSIFCRLALTALATVLVSKGIFKESVAGELPNFAYVLGGTVTFVIVAVWDGIRSHLLRQMKPIIYLKKIRRKRKVIK